MSQKTDKKVALITGGSQGIGAATARYLANKSWFVVINYNSNPVPADALVKELGETTALAIKANAGSVPDITSMITTIVEKFGKIDAVIANAAGLVMADLEGTTEDEFDSLMNLNVKGPYFLAQKAAPHMPAGSHIIFMSTSQCHASTVAGPYLLYCTTKGAVEHMARILAKDLGRKGIFVNTVAPGPTGTELFYRGKSEQVLNMLKGLSPHGRFGEADEVGEVIGFLCESKWVSGQVVKVNGAMV